MSQTIILSMTIARAQAARMVNTAPQGAVVKIDQPRRSNDQNSLLWALLSEISRAKPEGRSMPPEIWKCLFMQAAGFSCTFEPGLDGQGVVPLGFKSSRLTKVEFSELIDAIHEYAARHQITLTDELAA